MKTKVDILDYIMEGILLIECENRKWRLVAYQNLLTKQKEIITSITRKYQQLLEVWKTGDIYQRV